jgi:hypothetical protein
MSGNSCEDLYDFLELRSSDSRFEICLTLVILGTELLVTRLSSKRRSVSDMAGLFSGCLMLASPARLKTKLGCCSLSAITRIKWAAAV